MIKKVRFIEPGNYTASKNAFNNFFTYNNSINNPSTGLITLTTIVNELVSDTLMYSEAISDLLMEDIIDADIIFFSINTYNSIRGYLIVKQIRAVSDAILIFGGLHASLHFTETISTHTKVFTHLYFFNLLVYNYIIVSLNH